MEKLTREDAVDFYGKHYAPDNAILVVAGDVTAAELRPLAEKYYGPLAPAKFPRRVRPQEPPMIAARRVLLDDPRVEQPSLARLYLSPSYTTAKDRMAYAIEVMSDILGGGDTSRLSKSLVEEQKIAVSASAYYDGDGLDDTYLFIGATPNDGVTLEQLETAVDKVIADFVANGVTDEELTRSKTVLTSAAIYSRDSQYQMARIYGSALVSGETIEDVEAWPSRIAEVTKADVQKAAAELLQINRSVTGLLRKKTQEAQSQ
jgi:zinc protease